MKQLFKYFLYLGVAGFGGPLMLIQQMREHYVDDLKELTGKEFDQAFTLIKAMPGPIAFQMAVFLGNRLYKSLGGLVAGFALLLPSFIMMVTVAYFYASFVNVSFIHPVLDGFLFSVSAVILISLKSLVINNYKFIIFIPLVLLNMFLCWKQILPEPLLIVGFGLLAVFINQKVNRLRLFSAAFLLVDWQTVYDLFKLGLVSGAVVFGTGLALIPVLKTNLVDIHHWLSLKEFNDGVIFGQMTPGPITITGAFLGYRISGFMGSLGMMFGIFLMPFFHMMTWFPYAIKWLGGQKWINNFLVGATSAVVGSILVTIINMNAESYNKIMFWVLFLANFAILILKPKTSILLLIVISGLLNLLFFTAMNSI